MSTQAAIAWFSGTGWPAGRTGKTAASKFSSPSFYGDGIQPVPAFV